MSDRTEESRADRRRDVLATSFVVDDAHEGSTFPSAGGLSSEPAVQMVYWRCIVDFFFSARLFNPGMELVFFTNREPPRIAGRPVRQILEQLGASVRIVPLTHRLAAKGKSSWGNVLYFFDIFEAMSAGETDGAILLLDCDVIVTRPLDTIFERFDGCDFTGYPLDRDEAFSINGLNRLELTAIAAEFFQRTFDPPVTPFGGEFFGATLSAWRQYGPQFRAIFERARDGRERYGSITTEEHIFAIAFAGLDARIWPDTSSIKRMWTAHKHRTVRPGDETIPLWHLPAEKLYGLKYLFEHLQARDFAIDIDADTFRHLAAGYCGIPNQSLAKVLRDTAVRAKAALR